MIDPANFTTTIDNPFLSYTPGTTFSYLLTRPVGRPPNHVVRTYASFRYQAASWTASRRVVAKVEWHPGELYPRAGFIVTNLSRPPENIVAFYKMRGR